MGPLSLRLRFAQDMEWYLRAAAFGDVGRIDGADQALHRDHPASMSVNDGAPILVDLRERQVVFDVLFGGQGGQLDDAERLHDLARRTLASEALWWMLHAYDRGRTGQVDFDAYEQFVFEIYPEAKSLPMWRAWQRRLRVGAQLSPYVPTFKASVVWTRLRKEYRRRRHQRLGI
jgi:hypothetical protein